jgi:hypothetical protein
MVQPRAAAPAAKPVHSKDGIRMLKQTAQNRANPYKQKAPSNAIASSTSALRAVKPQAIKSWGKKERDTWTPSPKYQATPSPKKPEPEKKKTGKKKRLKPKASEPGRRRFAGESRAAFAFRRAGEKSDWKQDKREKKYKARRVHHADTEGAKNFANDPESQRQAKYISSGASSGRAESMGYTPHEAPIAKTKLERLKLKRVEDYRKREIGFRQQEKNTVRGPSDRNMVGPRAKTWFGRQFTDAYGKKGRIPDPGTPTGSPTTMKKSRKGKVGKELQRYRAKEKQKKDPMRNLRPG